MSNLITLKQIPIIEEKLKTISERIDEKIALADSLVCSDGTVKQVKAMRAELNKEFADLEDDRKAVKSGVMAPYEEFETVYKKYVSEKYRSADARLKEKISTVEDGLKKSKEDDIKAYFWEYAESLGIDFLEFEDSGIGITLSASAKSLKQQAKDFIDRVSGDLQMIETQEHKEEILVEYKRVFNMAKAVAVVTERHKAIEAQKERQKAEAEKAAAREEAVEKVERSAPAPIAAPIEQLAEDSDPVIKVQFTMHDKKSNILEVKKFMDERGYKYE